MTKRLGIGMVGSGFNAKFHLLGFQGVRNADVLGVWSPNHTNAADTAAMSTQLGVGDAKPYPSIAAMVEDPAIDAIWVSGPNHARIENVEEVVSTLERGKGALLGIACEKPLARNVSEAKQVLDLVSKVGLPHGYLENQVFAPPVEVGRNLLWARGAKTTGRPYLARAAEEHSGPHAPWFWQGKLQGGGVLTDPAKPVSSLRPTRVTGHIASLKWSRPAYSKRLTATMGKDVNYDKTPSEDFASVIIEFQTDDGQKVLGEATTSWSFVGAGLRLSAELLGPEYSLQWNSLDSGQMPVVAGEAWVYGYEAEDRYFVDCFLNKRKPWLTFDDGLQVVKVLMTAYMSAEQGKTLDFPGPGVDTFVPAVAKGTWKP